MTTGEEKRQFIYIDDVCAALHYGVASGLQGVYDITSFEWIQIIDVANIISKITGAEIIPGDIVGSTPLTPIMGKMPGWLPKVSLEEGLNRLASNFEGEKGRSK
jgi:nucleoside-diphosphate-sugar epimerase